MAAGTVKDEKLVGIVPLEPDWSQPGIERLGPPPGNAEILIRGGAGWVFGIPTREETPHPNIERLGKAPSQDEVALALAREMAWRWFTGRPPFVYQNKEKGVGSMARKLLRYADVEADFLMQALGLIPKSVELAIETLPGSDQKSTCACTEGTRCCAGVCQPCQGG